MRLAVGSLLLAAGGVNAACYQQSEFPKAKWPHCMSVNSQLDVYTGPEDDFLKLGMHVSGGVKGWTSLAFGGNGGMKGAHEVVVRQKDSVFVAEDRYSNDYVTPQLDGAQHTKLIFASQDSEKTTWAVLLPMNTCDDQDYPILDINGYMLWAFGATHDFSYHGQINRGQFHLNPLSGPKVVANLTDITTHKLVAPKIEVKATNEVKDKSNPYKCAIHDLTVLMPGVDLDSKKHVVKFTPFLDPASEKYVHHMILYGCSKQPPNLQHNSVVQECESMPPGCSNMLWAWAKGSLPVQYPEDVGMPIGENLKWTALQLHYYNPSLDTGKFDSSGVEMAVSNKVMTYDAAMLEFNGGTNPNQRGPLYPGESSYTLPPMLLPKVCTNAWTQDLNVLGAVHHQHLVGKQMKLEVSRAGKNMGQIRLEHHYDFNHQSLEPSPIKTLKPGDEILMTCTYDTSKVTAPTAFGDQTQNEMCYALVMYYPAQQVSSASYVPFDPQTNAIAKQICTNPGFGSYNNISACGALYISDFYQFTFQAPGVGIGALEFCNNGGPFGVAPNIKNLTVQEITAQVGRAICPPCYQTSSCTGDMLPPFAATQCKPFCLSSGYSLWPDMSQSPSSTAGKTFCHKQVHVVDASAFPHPETCVKRGDLSSTAAEALVKDNQPTTPPSPKPPTAVSSSGRAAPLMRCVSALLLAIWFAC